MDLQQLARFLQTRASSSCFPSPSLPPTRPLIVSKLTLCQVLSRGCRCIEIDVWNGDARPSRHHDRARAISWSSLPNAAQSIVDTVDDTARHCLGDKPAASTRSPSPNSRSLMGDNSSGSSLQLVSAARDSSARLEVSRTITGPLPCLHLPRGEPIVTHGWTLTTYCGFREVCEAIRETAFVDNSLPVIISLEVHADVEQQEVMVQIMKEVWQDMLVSEPLDGCDPKFRVPTLDLLRNKIFVKVKRARANMVSVQDTNDPLEDEASVSDDEQSASHFPPQLDKSISISGAAVDKSHKVRICRSLAELAVYTRSERFQSLETPEAKLPTHIFSISENRILEMSHKHKAQVLAHNKHYFMRAFPAGRRIDSSNPDPSLFWRNGVQMVAMNWQSMDEGMMLNDDMFRDGKGWVLKPPGYRSCDKAGDTLDEPPAPSSTLDFHITILAGHNLPTSGHDSEAESGRGRSTIRPFVKVELHVERTVGSEKDESALKQRTEAGKTRHPTFGPAGNKLTFVNIPRVVEELSFVRIKIEDESWVGSSWVSCPPLAWACIRLDRLRQGYRFISLMYANGNVVPGGKLLVKVVKLLR